MKTVPFDIAPFSIDEDEEIQKCFKAKGLKWYKCGNNKVCLPGRYIDEHANEIYNFELRPDDIWTSTIPRSGTTVSQEIIWLIANNMDFDSAKKNLLMYRFPEIEQASFVSLPELDVLKEDAKGDEDATKFVKEMGNSLVPYAENLPSPRFIKAHVKFEFLPPGLIDKCKVFYVCRYPKDVIVSYFHFNKMFKFLRYEGDFPTFWNLYRRNLLPFSDYWEHVNEAWKLRDHPNMCFLFYEEVIKDQKNAILKIANHLGKSVSEDDITKLKDHIHIDNFKNNPAVNLAEQSFLFLPKTESFIRKGEAGGWRDYFTDDINKEADEWIEQNIAKLPGFKFWE